MRASWDIFCSVIDNFGDIGVTWRLARQLVAEHGQQVRLWVDDLDAFCRLCPDASPDAERQVQQGVAIHHWPREWQPVHAADVVIEAFGCELPAAYIEAMRQRSVAPLWLNLEYLSAEDWVSACHGLPSPQPNGLQKYFFFPGFSPQTGGLLREAGLIELRLAFQQDPVARQQFLQRIGVEPTPATRLISLFAYENPALISWLDALASDSQASLLLVPEGRIVADLQRWLGVSHLAAGVRHSRGTLTVQVIAFLTQQDYDRLLWSCDLNAVRGEDSFVRAQWAGRPFLWQAYPQQEAAHLDKLEAFLELYCQGLSSTAQAALLGAWRAWNRGGEMGESWPALREALPELTGHAEDWCRRQAAQINIATGLVQFHQDWVKCATQMAGNPTLPGH